MAENPATWGPAERAINDAMDDWYEAIRSTPDLVGLSLPRRIADALREAGQLPAEPGTPQVSTTQNAQAFAAVTAIDNGEWDRYLLRILASVRARMRTREYQDSAAIDEEVGDLNAEREAKP